MVQLRSFVSLVGNGCVLDGLVIVTPGFWFRCQGEGRAGLVWVLGPGSREESTWRPAAAAKKKRVQWWFIRGLVGKIQQFPVEYMGRCVGSLIRTRIGKGAGLGTRCEVSDLHVPDEGRGDW